jgi:hypothetical protein
VSAVAILAVVVAAGEGQSPATMAMTAAATEALGAAAVVRLHEATPLSDAQALRVEELEQARAVVQLGWGDSARLRARLRMHAARTDRWIDREIVFVPADTVAERGRTLGFTIASMLPEADPTVQLSPPAVVEPRGPPAPEPPLGRRAIGLLAMGGGGLGGGAGGFGGVLDVESLVGDSFALCFTAGARWGSLPEIGGSELTAFVGAGGAWWPLAPTPTRHLGIALRAELLGLYQSVSHQRPAGATEWKGQALPGADLELEGSWRLGRSLELVLGGGAEVAFGTIDVSVVPAPAGGGTATIPVLRAVANAGIRMRF